MRFLCKAGHSQRAGAPGEGCKVRQILLRAQQVEDVLFQAAWRTVAKARRSSEQYEKIGATRLNGTSGSEGYSLFLANL